MPNNKNNKAIIVMIYFSTQVFPFKTRLHRQRGTAQLLFVVTMLSILTLMGITASKSSLIETHMANNIVETKKAIIAANSAVTYAWNESRANFNPIEFVENCEAAGAFDLRASAATSCTQGQQGAAKTRTVWNDIESSLNWSWSSTSQHQSMPNLLAAHVNFLTSHQQNNPMQLLATPQYATGIHELVLLKGSENYHCMPISIIGAGKGSTQSSQALVEIRAIPKSGCFRRTIQ